MGALQELGTVCTGIGVRTAVLGALQELGTVCTGIGVRMAVVLCSGGAKLGKAVASFLPSLVAVAICLLCAGCEHVNSNTSPLTAFVTKIRNRTTMEPLMPDDEFEFERSFGEQLDKTVQHSAEPLPPELWFACQELKSSSSVQKDVGAENVRAENVRAENI